MKEVEKLDWTHDLQKSRNTMMISKWMMTMVMNSV
jgi:hypothetical protein